MKSCLFLALAAAQCGPGGCLVRPPVELPAVRPVFIPVSQGCQCPCSRGGVCDCPKCPDYEWKLAPTGRGGEEGNQWLYHKGVQIGGFNGVNYHPWDGLRWLAPAECPTKLPERPVVGDNFGVDLSKIKDAPEYSVCGQPVTSSQAHDKIAGGGALVDDSQRPWIVIRTNDQNLKNEILAGLAPLKDEFRTACYTHGHWAQTGVGADHSLVRVMAADGKELHRQDDFNGGVPALVGAIRKADPKYDPAKTPDLRKSMPSLPALDVLKQAFLAPGPGGVPVWGYAAGAVLLLLLLRNRR